MTAALRFEAWLYGGPFLRVANPDTDLPIRDPNVALSREHRELTERADSTGPERIVPPFGDANSAGDILSELSLARNYPALWNEEERYTYPTIQGLLALVVLRLETKVVVGTGNRIRNAWFSRALEQVKAAQLAFAAGAHARGCTLASEAYQLVEQGNKAHRRKITFVVAPNGSARKV